jgi:uncharacterized protein DUF6916
MSISRRHFLRDAGGAVLATAVVQIGVAEWLLEGDGLGGASALAAGDALPAHVLDRLAKLSRADFTRSINKRFRLRQRGVAAQTLLLESVRDDSLPQQTTVDCFSLRFRAAAGQSSLQQGTYLLSGPSLGRFGLFLVPMGDDGAGPSYEAVINRLAA